MVFLQIVHEQFELYALNVYCNSYTRKRRYYETLQQWLLDLVAHKPRVVFLLAGDFNTKK